VTRRMFEVVACELLSSVPSLDIIAQAPIPPMVKPRHHASNLAPLSLNASFIRQPRDSIIFHQSTYSSAYHFNLRPRYYTVLVLY
jgi:hypothetical protein